MIRVVRLGSTRMPHEGPRLGTVRRPPRGVPKPEYARRDFYDVWVPDLAPSPALFSWIKAGPITDARWRTYARRYRAEMKRPEGRRLIELLAALSKHANFSVGCYCENEARCHRSLLRELLKEAGANVS
ncbi:MAG TPA: DUF488 family protein [Gemmatimonadales bacterium]|nr:DUF488 family protein [Gemmatimonadales bacterium]